MKKHIQFSALMVLLFLIGGKSALADVTNNLSVAVSPSGDVPTITVGCTAGHAYTEALYNDSLSFMLGTYGLSNGTYRKYCETGTISFDGWNMNTILDSYNGVDNWTSFIHTPFKYVIVDTTNEGSCNSTASCAQINLTGAWEGFRNAIYIPSTTCYNTEYLENACTLGAGPVWTTTPYQRTWTNVVEGDGSGNVGSTTPVGDSNVLFLPGLEASRLYMQTPSKCPLNCEDQLWEPNTNADPQDLFLNLDGTSINKAIYTGDIINTTNTPINLGPLEQDIYKSFSTMMDGLVASNKITAWQAYAYDWRQGVQDIVDNGTQYKIGQVSLTDTLKGLINSSKNGKVTIVAHSNGGLVAKALLKKLEDDKIAGRNNLIDDIDNVILVASPQLGTPTAIPALLHGYDQDIDPFFVYPFMNVSTARILGQNMPSAYGLLPSAEYFNRVSTPVVSFVSNLFDPYISKDISTYTSHISNYGGEKGFILGIDGRNLPQSATDTLQPIKGNSTLFAQAESLHNSIDNLSVPSNVHIVQIAGWGLDTISGFQYNDGSVCSSSTENGCTGTYLLDEKPIFTSDGDKTVVTPSALAMSGEKWWLNLEEFNSVNHSRINHDDILESTSILDFISNIIQRTSIAPSIYFSTSTPANTSNRLNLSVHSPVSIGVYDNSGDFTGKACDNLGGCVIQENIPNSSYYEFGEGKYVNLGQGDLQKAVLQGTDVGTFTFDWQTVAPNGQTTISSFEDIPVTTQTQATITTNPTTQTPQLVLDVTGDGVPDFTLAPSTTFDPVTYLQVMKATINSLDLTQAKINAFNNRVDNIIKLIQKGKIDKAKLKAEKFVTVLQNKLAKPDPKKPKSKKLSKTDAQTLLDLLNGLLDNLN